MKKILMDTFVARAKTLGYKVDTFKADRRIYKISKGKNFVFTVGKHLPLNTKVSNEIARRKDLTKQILNSFGIPTPKGVLASRWGDVLVKINKKELSFPLVVKPDISSLGKMVTANIATKEELHDAFFKVKNKFGDVIVEEFCNGDDHRFLVLDGRVLMVTKRGLPYITGDGKHKVFQLIKLFNKVNTWPLKFDNEVKRCLKEAGYGVNDIPEKGKKIVLRMNANNTSGGTTENITKNIDEEFNKVAILATKILGLRFSGVDIIAVDISDIKKGYFITEVNSDPGYDLSLSQKLKEPYDATEDILKVIFR